jgi:hypothetical protein
MQERRNRVENGAVLSNPDGVQVTDEELAVIDAALAEARDPQRIDARTFLRELRLGR